MEIFLLLALFTITFVSAGIVTYRICRKKAACNDRADDDKDGGPAGGK